MADSFTAVLDSCVLYPFALRDLLVELATTDLFRGRWSPHIHDEWMMAVLRDFPTIQSPQVDRIRQLMDAQDLDAVVTGYEDLIESVTLPDPNDRHVVAAAIRCGAQVIVTRNLKHFPDASVNRFGIVAQHPDEFICTLLDLAPGAVCSAAKRCRQRLKRPPFSVDEYFAMLERQDLPLTVAELRNFAEVL